MRGGGGARARTDAAAAACSEERRGGRTVDVRCRARRATVGSADGARWVRACVGLVDSSAITPEELGLAARNHGMPLEALRYPITPVGLHYLLIHYDIPAVDPASFRLEIGGRVERALTLSLDDLRGRQQVTLPVTMECAGNGRARFSPRWISQPWLTEAVGTGEWTGTPLAPLLQEAGVLDSAADVVFTGADRGVEGGVTQDYQRALTPAEAMGDDVLLAYALNGARCRPSTGSPCGSSSPAGTA
jgi:DMSO/TMAO reductase YedYZ molybdopterin-dependent catalytic subunit